ncbi:MAG: ROK family protein [Granulosicoccus sp.]
MDGSSIIRSDDLRNQNRLRILNTLRHQGPCSPSRLSVLTGLSAASISTLSSQMIDQGILLSDTRTAGKKQGNTRGRPQSRLSLNAQAATCVSLSLAVDSIAAQRVDYAGKPLHSYEKTLKTRSLSTQQIIDTVIDSIEQLCAKDSSKELRQIGVAFQGMTEHSSGNLLWSPIIQETNVPLGDALKKHFAVGVNVNNDCALISQALSREHNATLGNSFATIFFSYGVGLGLYLDGKPFAGIHSSALELGHLRFEPNGALCRCGKRGCIEAYAADYGIERMAQGDSIEDIPSGRISATKINELIDSANSGELACIQAFTIAGAAVGEGLANLFTLLDPMPVALVGRSQQGFELMRSGINKIISQSLRSDFSSLELLHCFEEVNPLLESGLNHSSLSAIDREFSQSNQDVFLQSHV